MEALQGETQGWGELRQTSLHKLMFSWQGYEQALRIRDVTSACLFLRIRQSSSLLFLLRKPCLTSPGGQWWIWNQWLCMLIPVHPFRRLCMASTTQPGQELFLCEEKKKKQKAEHAGKSMAEGQRGVRCGSLLPSANYLPLNLLKAYGLRCDFCLRGICQYYMAIFFDLVVPHWWLNKCLLHSRSFPGYHLPLLPILHTWLLLVPLQQRVQRAPGPRTCPLLCS